MTNPRDLIEQAAREPELDTNGHGKASRKVFESEIELSKAISLKRIADVLDEMIRHGAQINVDRRGH